MHPDDRPRYATLEQVQAEMEEADARRRATVEDVDRDLARRLRRASKAVEAAVSERNQLVFDATAAGCSTRAIANELGVSHVAVFRIIQRAKAAATADTEGGE